MTKVVLINCNNFHLLHHASGQMHVNMIISEPAIKIITVYTEIFVVLNFRIFEIVMIFHNGVKFSRIRFRFALCISITL